MNDLTYLRMIMWFFFGSITHAVMDKYGWWGLVLIPLWFIIDYGAEKMINYKPKQRTIKDYEKKDED